MTELEFRQHIKAAAEEVRNWPAWKRNILAQCGQPTVAIARTPVIYQADQAGSEQNNGGDAAPCLDADRE